ncbi:unnamed protein product, partial [Larinioides sclopetarius]
YLDQARCRKILCDRLVIFLALFLLIILFGSFKGIFIRNPATMFSLSKGEPPTPPSTATSPPTAEIATPCELPQFQKTEVPLRTQSAPMTMPSTSTDQQTEIGVSTRDIPPIRTHSAPMEPDSGFEASPCGLSDPGSSNFHFFADDNDVGFDDVFVDDDTPEVLLEREEDDDEWCSDCGEISSCSCSRAESSATVRAAATSFTDPNTCDSDSSNRSSSPLSPPPSSWPIPASCAHIHNDRLPCPRCSGDESLEDQTSSMSYLQNIVASRSYPGSYPAALLHWWTQSSPSSSVFSPRVAAALSRTSNRSDDRRSSRSRRRQIDSDASSSSSCDENSADELFPTSCEGASYLEDLATMTETEELRVTSPEQLPDLVPLSSESSSRRVRSQSVSIPLDHEYIREIGSSLRRFSNEFENRFAVRNGTVNHGGRH